MAICGMQSNDCPYPPGPDRAEWRIGYRSEIRKIQRGMAKFKMEQADRLAEVYRLKVVDLKDALEDLIADVEGKWGDPHTLRYAKKVLLS